PFLPLTHAEACGQKPLRLVRAAARFVLITQQHQKNVCLFIRHPIKGLELPGGAIDPDETPQQAGLRELAEETGIHLPADHPVTLIAMFPFTDPRGGNWLDIIFSTCMAPTQLPARQEAEFPLCWLTGEEIKQQVTRQANRSEVALAALTLYT